MGQKAALRLLTSEVMAGGVVATVLLPLTAGAGTPHRIGLAGFT
jgi:hypothetical protein